MPAGPRAPAAGDLTGRRGHSAGTTRRCSAGWPPCWPASRAWSSGCTTAATSSPAAWSDGWPTPARPGHRRLLRCRARPGPVPGGRAAPPAPQDPDHPQRGRPGALRRRRRTRRSRAGLGLARTTSWSASWPRCDRRRTTRPSCGRLRWSPRPTPGHGSWWSATGSRRAALEALAAGWASRDRVVFTGARDDVARPARRDRRVRAELLHDRVLPDGAARGHGLLASRGLHRRRRGAGDARGRGHGLPGAAPGPAGPGRQADPAAGLEPERRAFGAAARARVEAEFTLERSVDEAQRRSWRSRRRSAGTRGPEAAPVWPWCWTRPSSAAWSC